MKPLVLFVFICALAVPAGAQSTAGADALQYYVGNWSCVGGTVGQPTATATVAYTLDSGVLRESVMVAPQGKMTSPFFMSIATTYDAKNDRYVQTDMSSNGSWSVSFAKPMTGNTEQWADHSSSDPLGRSEVVRTDKNTYSIAGYSTPAATTPNFKATCNRS